MKRIICLVLALGLIMAAVPAVPALAGLQQKPVGGAGWCNCPPPRFQIFMAPKPYGGLILLDTKTGESYQRIIVNTKQGIAIRWMKLQMKGPQPGESIMWD